MTPARATTLADTRLVALQAVPAADALLTVAECEKELPFMVHRAFIIRTRQHTVRRGNHAHRTASQFLICVGGAIDVGVYDGTAARNYVLTSTDQGLYIPPGIWAEQIYGSEATLLVLSDALYQESDYIRHYQAFLDFKGLSDGRAWSRVLNA